MDPSQKLEKRVRRFGVVLVLAFGVLLSRAAHAGPSEKSVAILRLEELSRDPIAAEVANDALVRARDAAERARRMRLAGDEVHAKLADALMMDWLDTASERIKAAKLERAIRLAQRSSLAAKEQIERERLLLDDAVARVERLRLALAKAQQSNAVPRVARPPRGKPADGKPPRGRKGAR